MNERARGLLGLCARAGGLRSGEAVCEQLARRAGAYLFLIDQGASENAYKALADACHSAELPLVQLPAGVLGDSIGKPGRMAAAVTDRRFADRLYQLISGTQMDAGVH